MNRNSKLGKLVFCVASCAVAWIMGRLVLWWILEILITYDVPDYESKRALAGVIALSILSIVVLVMRDKYTLNVPLMRVKLDYIEQINSKNRYRLFEMFVLGVLITFSSYISMYWFYQADFWLSINNSTVNFNLFKIFSPFPTLMVLGTLVFLNAVISGYVIILEPWRPIALNILYRKYAVKKAKRTKYLILGILSLVRISIYITIQIIYYWFSIPNLNTRVPATIIFVIMFCFWVFYGKWWGARRRTT